MAEQNQAVTRKVCPADLPPRLGKSPYVTCPVEQFRVISASSAAILLLLGKSELLSINYTSWDLMPDGQHFIMIEQTHPDPPKTELHLIQNWFEELKRLVPIK